MRKYNDKCQVCRVCRRSHLVPGVEDGGVPLYCDGEGQVDVGRHQDVCHRQQVRHHQHEAEPSRQTGNIYNLSLQIFLSTTAECIKNKKYINIKFRHTEI